VTAPKPSFLSTKKIPPEERLIVALDVAEAEEARRLVETLRDAVRFYKIGLELFMTGEAFALADWLRERGNKVFADFKLYDVPATVGAAVRRMRRRGFAFATVHGDDAILEAALRERGDDLQILAVTVLTSLDDADLRAMGYALGVEGVEGVEGLVLARARRALALGCDGVIASGREARRLREELGERLLIVTPGIRPAGDRPRDDQKRVVTVEEAFLSGADYVVVGRPIRSAPDPCAAARAIQGTIQGLFL
jgi:orotidine-5'-phosphate decarboxylase